MLRRFDDPVNLLKKIYRNSSQDPLLKNLESVLNIEHPHVIESIKQKICPFCGLYAKTEYGLWIHIRTRCSKNAVSIIRDVLEKYFSVNKLIRKYFSGGKVKYTVMYTGMWFNSFEDAYLYLKK